MCKSSLRTTSILKSLRSGTCLLLAGMLTAGAPIFAGEPTEIRSSDVALNAGGIMKGTVLSTTAQPVAGVPVDVLHEEKIVATTMSDVEGRFSFKGLRNGAHVIQVGKTQQTVRLWGTNTAPPAAVENLAIVVDEEAVRGQMENGLLPAGRVGGFVANNAGLLLLAGGAAAIAIGTSQDNSASPASP
jgi:hypothetical protein